jgi:rsbT co-antagonist protein RsbR
MTDVDPVADPAAELARVRGRFAELEREVATLRASEAELRAMFAAMTDAVLVVDRDGRYLRLPETAPGMVYKPAPEFLGKRMHDVLPAGSADAFLADIRCALAERRIVNMVYSRQIGDQLLWFSANASPMSDDAVVVVCRDITEQKRHEQVLRDSIRQQELLREQEAALLQLSTPLIPIRDDIVVMPLVGRLDAARIEQAQETLLQGITAVRAKAAIVDITGVPTIDVAAAEGLVRIAGAVQLLGARVVVTGIRPDVADTLASLDELGGLVTRGTLKAAIRDVEAGLGQHRPGRRAAT